MSEKQLLPVRLGMFEDRVGKVWNIESKAWKEFLLQRISDLLCVFEGVFEAARPW